MDRIQLSTIGTVCGAIVLFLCIFYDQYKRRDLNIKKKKKMLKKCIELDRLKSINFNDIYDPRERQSYILHEIELAETFMSENNVYAAVNHFANAIVICEEPLNIIKALGQTLPPKVYEKLMKMLLENYGEKFTDINKKLENEAKLMRIF